MRVAVTRARRLTRLAAVPTPSDTLREQLAEFIAIPSVSADAAHAADIVAAAEWIANKIRSAGGSAELVPWGVRPSSSARCAASERPSRRRPSSATRTSTSASTRSTLGGGVAAVRADAPRRPSIRARGSPRQGEDVPPRRGLRQLAAAGELPVNVRFAFDGEEESGATRSSNGSTPIRAPRMRLSSSTARCQGGSRLHARCSPAWTTAYSAGPDRQGTDMHSGMFGAAALNATHAPHGCSDRRLSGRRPPASRRLRQGAALVPSAEELEAWDRGPPGRTADKGRVADRAGRCGGGRRAHVRGYFARRERHRERIAGTREDRAAGRGAPQRVHRLAPGQDPER